MKWISVKDELPKEKPHRIQFLLICKENNVVMQAMFNTKTKTFMNDFQPLNHSVTHWMPLPEPPEEI